MASLFHLETASKMTVVNCFFFFFKEGKTPELKTEEILSEFDNQGEVLAKLMSLQSFQFDLSTIWLILQSPIVKKNAQC